MDELPQFQAKERSIASYPRLQIAFILTFLVEKLKIQKVNTQKQKKQNMGSNSMKAIQLVLYRGRSLVLKKGGLFGGTRLLLIALIILHWPVLSMTVSLVRPQVLKENAQYE